MRGVPARGACARRVLRPVKFSLHIRGTKRSVADTVEMTRFARLRRSLEELFPERHLYVRSGGEMRAFVLTTGKQVIGAGAVAAGALWMGVCTAAMLVRSMAISGH